MAINREILHLLRPKQWFKSLYVLLGAAPALFLMSPSEPPYNILLCIILGVANLVMVQGMSYIINDVADRSLDRMHPSKKRRPLASGSVSDFEAGVVFLALLMASTMISLYLDVRILAINVVILMLNASYSLRPLRFRDAFLVDILSIGWTAPLRVLVGWIIFEPYNRAPLKLVADVWSSEMDSDTIQWLLFHSPSKIVSLNVSMSTTTLAAAGMILSTYFLAVFLLASKRLAELLDYGGRAGAYRPALSNYTPRSLKFVIAASSLFLVMSAVVLSLSIKPVLLALLPPSCLMLWWYYSLVFKPDTPVKEPERIFLSEGKFTASGFLLVALGLLLLVI